MSPADQLPVDQSVETHAGVVCYHRLRLINTFTDPTQMRAVYVTQVQVKFAKELLQKSDCSCVAFSADTDFGLHHLISDPLCLVVLLYGGFVALVCLSLKYLTRKETVIVFV